MSSQPLADHKGSSIAAAQTFLFLQLCKRASIRTIQARGRDELVNAGPCTQQSSLLWHAKPSLHACTNAGHWDYHGINGSEQVTCEKLAFLVCRAKVVNLTSQRRRPSSLKASLLSLSLGPYLHQTSPEPVNLPPSYSKEPSLPCALALRAHST